MTLYPEGKINTKINENTGPLFSLPSPFSWLGKILEAQNLRSSSVKSPFNLAQDYEMFMVLTTLPPLCPLGFASCLPPALLHRLALTFLKPHCFTGTGINIWSNSARATVLVRLFLLETSLTSFNSEFFLSSTVLVQRPKHAEVWGYSSHNSRQLSHLLLHGKFHSLLQVIVIFMLVECINPFLLP